MSKPAPSPGTLLRKKRIERGLSVSRVADELCLSRAKIEAIEADDYASLPGRTYVLGYWKNYARLLEIPFDDVINANKSGVTERSAVISVDNEYPDERVRGDRSIRRVITLVTVLLAGFLAVTWYTRNAERVAERIDLSAAAGRSAEKPVAEGKAVEEIGQGFAAGEETPAGGAADGGTEGLPVTVPQPVIEVQEEAVAVQPPVPAEGPELPGAAAEKASGEPSAGEQGAGEEGVAPGGEAAVAAVPEAQPAEETPTIGSPAGAAPAEPVPEQVAEEQASGKKAGDSVVETETLDLDSWNLPDEAPPAAAAAAGQAGTPTEPTPPTKRPAPPKPKPEIERKTAQKSEKPAPKPAARKKTAASAQRITVTALKKTWLDVRDANNRRLVNRTVKRGTVLTLTGKPPFSFFVGTPDGVHVVYGGRRVSYRPDSSGKFARFKAGG